MPGTGVGEGRLRVRSTLRKQEEPPDPAHLTSVFSKKNFYDFSDIKIKVSGSRVVPSFLVASEYSTCCSLEKRNM